MARPPKPSQAPRPGYKWVWSSSKDQWVQKPVTVSGSTGTGTLEIDTTDPNAKPDGSMGGAQGAIHQGMNPPTVTQNPGGGVTITPPPPMPIPGGGGGGTPPPGKDPDDPCPEGYHLDKELGVCVLDLTGGEDDPCPPGWHLDASSGKCVKDGEEEPDQSALNDHRARLTSTLQMFGLDTDGLRGLIEQAVREDWSTDTFLQEMRKHPDYLANPLYRANIERAASGQGFKTEGEVRAYAVEVRRLAKQFGYAEPSDNYIAQGFLSGKSLAEYEHHLTVQERVKQFGGAVALVYKNITGEDPSDQDLHELFDPEKNTAQINKALRMAEYMGRPFTLGLGIRSEAEAKALEMLGVSPDEAFARYEQVGQGSTRFERLGVIEELITAGLPEDWSPDLSSQENSLIIQAYLFKNPQAQMELDQVLAREVARWKQGGGAVAGQGGQQIGLLSTAEKQTFG